MVRSVRSMTAAALVALAAVGCGGGGDGVPRVPVSGSVTLDGEPVSKGQISLLPEDGENVASGPIRDGRYSIPRAEGPSPGAHRVTIWSQMPTGRQIVADELNPDEGMIDEVAEVIPERYNVRTELTADVRQGSNAFDFTLTTEGAAP